MDNDNGKQMADGTGILDSKESKTLSTVERGTGRRDELAFSSTAGITGSTGTTGTEATNVTAGAAMASGLAGDARTADSRGLTSLDERSSERIEEPRHEGPVPVSSSRDWLHESGLHGEEAAAELGAVSGPGPAVPIRPLTGETSAAETRDRTGISVRDAEADVRSAGTALGWAALLFAITSLFIWPLLMGATAAVLGYIAYRQGAQSLGVWSMTLGVIAVAAYFLLSPLYAALT